MHTYRLYRYWGLHKPFSRSLANQQQQTTTTTTRRRIVSQEPSVSSVRTVTVEQEPAATEVVEGVFGLSGANNVNFDSPDFNYQFDLN